MDFTKIPGTVRLKQKTLKNVWIRMVKPIINPSMRNKVMKTKKSKSFRAPQRCWIFCSLVLSFSLFHTRFLDHRRRKDVGRQELHTAVCNSRRNLSLQRPHTLQTEEVRNQH